ncbi:MAG: enoyl-CoA hydratase-related protein, partial [Saprospiraceae bacterium]
IIQAAEKMDAGPVWASACFQMRKCSKSALYRHEVTQAGIQALLQAVQHFEKNDFPNKVESSSLAYTGKWRRRTIENDFKFSWNEPTATILKKINAADSYPGAITNILDEEYACFGGVEEKVMKGSPGDILAIHNESLCIATSDGALWIQCLQNNIVNSIKLPSSLALGEKLKDVKEISGENFIEDNAALSWHDIRYEESNEVGYLYFNFYNGAMSTSQCNRLRETFISAKARPTKGIVMMGGEDIWSNGIHLNLIEAAENPAKASWENINAMNDLIREIICTDSHYTISAIQGNAGAGGVALALAADKILAMKGIVFNPHTRNMGLYGSEYWTYLFPRRIGTQRAQQFTEQCLPWGTDIALEVKLIDDCLEGPCEIFCQKVRRIAEELTQLSYFPQLMNAKRFKRNRDERYKPLQQYRDEEMVQMHLNFYEDNMGFDYKRYCFVHKLNPDSENTGISEIDLFSERRKIWRRRKYDKLYYEV